MANLTKMKDGRYRIVVELPPDPLTGERRRKFITGSNKQDVRERANKLIAKIETGNLNNCDKLTVEGYLSEWVKVYCEHLSATTAEGYKIYINKHIIPYLGRLQLAKIKPMHIEDFYNKEYEKKYKAKTVLQEHRILHKAFYDAVKNELIAKNPCDYVKAPSPDNFQPNIYTKEDFKKLLCCVMDTPDEMPILLAGMCGLRRSEVLGLMWTDIDFENAIINVRRAAVSVKGGAKIKEPKNKTSLRTFAFSKSLIPIFKKYKGIGYVCHHEDGTPLNGKSFSHHFHDILEKNNLKLIRFHDLRHFNATMMLRLGISDKEASERLGHSTPAVTRKIYQHVLDDMDKEAATKLNEILL